MNIETQTPEPDRGIGDNLPPVMITEQLEQDHKSIFDRITQLLESSKRVPEKITDEDTHKKALDLFKMMRVALKSADETRKIEKEPWMEKAKEVDGCFGKWTGPLKTAFAELKDKTERFSEAKKERERIAREEKARQEREAAEAREREAREAERRRIEAEEAKRKAEAAAKAAQEERQRAEAEARRQKELAEEAKRQAAWAEEERERLRAEKLEAEAAQRKAREDAQVALEKRRAAEDEARKAAAEAKAEGRVEKEAFADAVNAEKRADKLDRSAQAGTADLSRSRSDRGTVGSLAEVWVAHIEDIDAVPLEEIRGFISHDAIRVAVNLFVKAGGRQLNGVRIEKENQIRVV